MMLSATLVMTIADFYNQRERSREEVQRDALETIDRLMAEFGSRLAHSAGKTVTACYVRYSTDLQNSFESQLRSIFSYAAAHDFSIARENIFYDLGISGAKYDRAGLNSIREAGQQGRFEAFMAFGTSRLARSLRTLLDVLDEEFVGGGIRCVLVDQTLDSKDRERWKLMLPLLGWLDDIQRTNQAGYVRSAHRNLLARRIHYSTSAYGIGGEVIPGFFTKRGRPVQMMVVDLAMAKVVRYIFMKFTNHVPIGWIVRRLNMHRDWPRPPKSKKNRFSRDFVRRVLDNPDYLGIFVYDNSVDVSMMSPDEMRELAKTDPNVFHFPSFKSFRTSSL